MAEVGNVNPMTPLPPISPENPKRDRRERPGGKDEPGDRQDRRPEGGEDAPLVDEYV